MGIVIGVGVFSSASPIASSLPSAAAVLGFWLLGGLLSLAGALCYAELATTYPREGGDFVYLGRAFGPRVAFLFAWAHLVVIRPATVSAIAFAFAEHALPLFGFEVEAGAGLGLPAVAVGAILAVTAVNAVGVRQGVWTQNLLTVLKVAGIALLIAAAFFVEPPAPVSPASPSPGTSNLSLALILILFTYGGWNEMAYVAAEVRDPARNLTRALVLGTVGITLIYVVLNLALLSGLGHTGLVSQPAPATRLMEQFGERVGLSPWPARGIGLLISLSALGALNGFCLTGARISHALGQAHPEFGLLGRWSARTGTPVPALLLQGALGTVVVILSRSFSGSVVYASTSLWAFFFLTGLSLTILRHREPDRPRPFRVPLHPVEPLVFCLTCIIMVASGSRYDPVGTLVSLGLIALGLPLKYLLGRRRPRERTSGAP